MIGLLNLIECEMLDMWSNPPAFCKCDNFDEIDE